LPQRARRNWQGAMPAQRLRVPGQARGHFSPISVVTLIRTDTRLDHSKKAEKVCSLSYRRAWTLHRQKMRLAVAASGAALMAGRGRGQPAGARAVARRVVASTSLDVALHLTSYDGLGFAHYALFLLLPLPPALVLLSGCAVLICRHYCPPRRYDLARRPQITR